MHLTGKGRGVGGRESLYTVCNYKLPLTVRVLV